MHFSPEIMSTSLPLPSRWLEEDDDESRTALDKFAIAMSNILLFFLIFGLSATVQVRNLKEQLTNKFAIATGVAMQFLIMPILGFIAVVMLRDNDSFTYAMGITLLVVTASPGGSFSNWWCSLFNAELALSVAMTSVSSILSIGLLPANLFLYTYLAYSVVGVGGEDDEDVNVLKSVDFGAVFISLGIVMGAILLGLYAGYKWDNATFHKRANGFGTICGLLLILFSLFLGSGSGDAEANFWSMDYTFYIAVAFPCVVGMALANIISRTLRLSPPEIVAISIECCYQNVAIATSVAVTMFSDPTERAQAVSVPLFYGFVEAVLIGVYCVVAWKVGWTKAPSNEKICVVISKTYEVEDEDLDEENPAQGSDKKGWWAQLFVPRVQEQDMERDVEVEGKAAADELAAGNKADRPRFYSADVTIGTSSISSPSTPGTPYAVSASEGQLETILQETPSRGNGELADLEIPPTLPPADDEHSADVDDASHTQSIETPETKGRQRIAAAGAVLSALSFSNEVRHADEGVARPPATTSAVNEEAIEDH